MGAKKIAAVAVLIVVIVFALVFMAKRSGLAGGGPTPPKWVLEQPIEKIDMDSGELITKQLQEWEKLGQKDGVYKSPTSGKYTMVGVLVCAGCKAKIPTPLPPANVSGEKAEPGAMDKWQQSVKCPKCGKNPYAIR